MIPFLNAFKAFVSIFALLPVSVRAFISTFLIISFGLALLKILSTRV